MNQDPQSVPPLAGGTLGWKLTEPSASDYPLDPRRQLTDSERHLFRLALEKIQHHAHAIDPGQAQKAIYQSCLQLKMALAKDRAKFLEKMILEAVGGCGGLSPLLEDPELEEIAITGAGQPVWVYPRGQHWKKTNLVFDQEQTLIDLANQMARSHGQRLSYHHPRLSVPLSDGSRLYAAMPPLTWRHTALTIRKFRPKVFSWEDFIRHGTMDGAIAALLKACMQADLNVLFVGNTGSGKTSLLNCAAAEIPLNQRILVIEDTPEIRLQHPHCIRLVAPAGSETAFTELVQDTLRMRPDRVIIGEARTAAEIQAVFDAYSSGQAKGTYATFHGRSAPEALNRIRALGVGEFQWRALDLVVVLRRITVKNRAGDWRETRVVTEISELSDGRLHPWIRWNADPKSPRWEHDWNRMKRSPRSQMVKVDFEKPSAEKDDRTQTSGRHAGDE